MNPVCRIQGDMTRRAQRLFRFRPEPFGYGASPFRYRATGGDDLPEEVFRFGVVLADGRKATNLEHRGSDGHHPVELLGHARKLGGRDPGRTHPREIFLNRPTGDRASLSDVDGNAVIEELPKEVSHRWNADALDLFSGLTGHKLGGVADEDDRALLARLHGAVRGDVERQRGPRRVARPGGRHVQDSHRRPEPVTVS
jgi:hypothetical protein